MAKRSFFERLTGAVKLDDETSEVETQAPAQKQSILAGDEEEGELSVDMYETPSEIVLKTMVAGGYQPRVCDNQRQARRR